MSQLQANSNEWVIDWLIAASVYSKFYKWLYTKLLSYFNAHFACVFRGKVFSKLINSPVTHDLRQQQVINYSKRIVLFECNVDDDEVIDRMSRLYLSDCRLTISQRDSIKNIDDIIVPSSCAIATDRSGHRQHERRRFDVTLIYEAVHKKGKSKKKIQKYCSINCAPTLDISCPRATLICFVCSNIAGTSKNTF